jgi:hypothetical protein
MATMQLVVRTSVTGKAVPAGADIRPDCRPEVVVLHTDLETTRRALKAAVRLAAGRAASIRLLVPQVVPYPLPIDNPPVPLQFAEQQLLDLLPDRSVESSIDVRLCRDLSVALASALRPVSLVVVGGRMCWWPTRESRLARRLARLGHQVVFTTH